VAAQAGRQPGRPSQEPRGNEALQRETGRRRENSTGADSRRNLQDGSLPAKKHARDEGPQVQVKIEPFWMGKYEIT